MSNLTPEHRARQQIDAQLIACGWVVQDYKGVDFSAGRGIALREAPLKSGTCDYLLLVDRKAVYVLVVFQYFYANSIFARVAGGVGINHFGTEKFSAIPFPLPPLAEQMRIVAEVERRLSVVEELEAVVSANLQRATRLRQSILQHAFSGKIS